MLHLWPLAEFTAECKNLNTCEEVDMCMGLMLGSAAVHPAHLSCCVGVWAEEAYEYVLKVHGARDVVANFKSACGVCSAQVCLIKSRYATASESFGQLDIKINGK